MITFIIEFIIIFVSTILLFRDVKFKSFNIYIFYIWLVGIMIGYFLFRVIGIGISLIIYLVWSRAFEKMHKNE